MSQEIWKDIPGYKGLYQISSFGNVKRGDKVRKTYISNGYYTLSLYKNGKETHKRIHRLLGETFIPNPENKPYIDHINRDKLDNRLENLKWATTIENSHNHSLYITNKLKEQNIGYSKHHKLYVFRIIRFGIKHTKYFKTLDEAKDYRDKYLQENKISY